MVINYLVRKDGQRVSKPIAVEMCSAQMVSKGKIVSCLLLLKGNSFNSSIWKQEVFPSLQVCCWYFLCLAGFPSYPAAPAWWWQHFPSIWQGEIRKVKGGINFSAFSHLVQLSTWEKDKAKVIYSWSWVIYIKLCTNSQLASMHVLLLCYCYVGYFHDEI